MTKRNAKRFLSVALMLAMVFTLCLQSYAAGLELDASEQPLKQLEGAAGMPDLTSFDAEALETLRTVSGRPSGLVGFTGDYSLDGVGGVVHVIVEFSNQPAPIAVLEAAVGGRMLAESSAEKLALSDHASFREALDGMFGVQTNAAGSAPYSITSSYYSAINGVALAVPAGYLAELAELDCVYAIYPDLETYVEPEDVAPHADPSQIGNAAGRSHMNVDELHDMGIKGAGVKVAVLDTGIDYDHPDLAGSFKGGKNFADYKKYYESDPENNPYPMLPDRDENDPMETTYEEHLLIRAVTGSGTYYTSHGTHVSGTVASTGVHQPTSSLGMAPEASLYVYRVLGPGGSGYFSWTIEAYDQIIEDDIEVANLSLGANVCDPYYLSAIAMNNVILTRDVVFALSASNNGTNGRFSIGAPGTSTLAITVANASASGANTAVTFASGENTENAYFLYQAPETTFRDNGDGTYSIVFPNLNETEDHKVKLVATMVGEDGLPSGIGAASEYTEEVRAAVAGNIVVINRGNNFLDSAAVAREAGAGGLLLIDNSTSYATLMPYRGIESNMVPFLTVEQSAGKAFWTAAQETEGYVHISALGTAPVTLSSGSSLGPVLYNGDIKPDITSHGSSVTSTVPYFVNNRNKEGEDIYYNAYGSMSGTSMSSPHICGVAVLLRQYSKDNELGWDYAEIKARIMNNANNVNSFLATYSVFEQGAGYADAKAAIFADSFITVPYENVLISGEETYHEVTSGYVASFNFGMDNYMSSAVNETLTGIIHNRGAEEKTYTITHEFNRAGRGVQLPETLNATLTHNATLTVPAGGSASFDVTFDMDAPTKDNVGSFEGYVHVTSGDESYVLPFAYTVDGEVMPFFNDIYLARPVISAGDSRQLEKSSSSDLVFNMASTMTHASVELLDGETFEEIGLLHLTDFRFNTYSRNTLYVVDDFLPGHYYTYDGQLTEFESGHKYIMRLYVFNNTTLRGIQDLPFFVDNGAPMIWVEQEEVPFTPGESLSVIGSVFDPEAANLNDNTITYKTFDPPMAAGTAFNAVFASRDGQSSRLAVDPDGAFYIPVDTSGEGYELTLYALDHFAPSLMEEGSPVFEPGQPYFEQDRVWYGANIVSKTIRFVPEQPHDITVSVAPTSIVAGLAAYLRVTVTGEQDGLTVSILDNGVHKYMTPVANGTARMYIDAAPVEPGVYDMVVTDEYGDILASCPVTVRPYNTNIWTANLLESDGYVQVLFNAVVAPGKPYQATVDGTSVQCSQPAPDTLQLDYLFENLQEGSKVTVKNVKLIELFPSYSFTYTLVYQNT